MLVTLALFITVAVYAKYKLMPIDIANSHNSNDPESHNIDSILRMVDLIKTWLSQFHW